MRAIIAKASIVLLPLALAACGGGGGGSVGGGTATPPPAATPTSFQSKFGTSFAATFDVGNTTDPRDPTAADVPALNTMADPIDN